MNWTVAQRMLIGIAIGDAFGAGYEMQPRWKVLKHFTFSRYSRKNKSKLGKYTDDTQMSIGVAEAILTKSSVTKESLSNWFVKCYARDKRGGYGSGMSKILPSSKDGMDFLHRIGGKSEKNGAAMRAIPIGVLPLIEDVVAVAKTNAMVTHNTPKGIASSIFVASASHYIYHDIGPLSKISDYCIDVCKGIDAESDKYFREIQEMDYLNPSVLFGEKDKRFGVPVDGMRTAGAVMWIIQNYSNSVRQALIESVLLGGDTDSTASIVTGLLAMKNGLDDIPEFLYSDLEDGQYGKKYLLSLGKRLGESFPHS